MYKWQNIKNYYNSTIKNVIQTQCINMFSLNKCFAIQLATYKDVKVTHWIVLYYLARRKQPKIRYYTKKAKCTTVKIKDYGYCIRKLYSELKYYAIQERPGWTIKKTKHITLCFENWRETAEAKSLKSKDHYFVNTPIFYHFAGGQMDYTTKIFTLKLLHFVKEDKLLIVRTINELTKENIPEDIIVENINDAWL